MDRKFRIELILKEFARLWYVLVALVLVCAAIGGLYSAFIAKAEYTATASVSIQMTSSYTGEGASGMITNAKSNLRTDVISALLFKDINDKIKVLNDGKEMKDADYAEIYTVNSDSNTYSIKVKWDNEKDAVSLASFFMCNVIDRVNAAKTTAEFADYKITPTVSDAPSIVSYDEPAPIWFTMIIGAILGIAIHAVVSFFVYYANGKFYDADEFKDTFIVPLIEEDFDKNGFSGAAIMLSRRRTEGVPFVIALSDGFDTEKVTGGFASIGCRVAVGGADEIAAGSAAVLDGEVVSRIINEERAGKLMEIKNAVSELKEKFKGEIDIIVAVASPETVRKDLYILSDAADATVVKIDLKSATKKQVGELLDNLKSPDDGKYVAAVI